MENSKSNEIAVNQFTLIRQISKDELGAIFLGDYHGHTVLIKAYYIEKANLQFLKRLIHDEGKLLRIELFKDEKAIYAIIKDKIALKELQALEKEALQSWQNNIKREFEHVDYLIKKHKGKIIQKKSKIDDNKEDKILSLMILLILLVIIISLFFGVWFLKDHGVMKNWFYNGKFKENQIQAYNLITLPNFYGQNINLVKQKINKLSLIPKIKGYYYNNRFLAGQVINTEPLAGQKVQIGETINLEVSLGKKINNENQSINVPNIINMEVSKARNILKKRKLSLLIDDSLSKYSITFVKESIIDQIPKVNTKLKNQSIVKVGISKGVPLQVKGEWFSANKEDVIVDIVLNSPAYWPSVTIKIVENLDGQNKIIKEQIVQGAETFSDQFLLSRNSNLQIVINNKLFFSKKVLEVVK